MKKKPKPKKKKAPVAKKKIKKITKAKKPVKKTKKSPPRKPKKSAVPLKKKPKIEGKWIGSVTHYFPHVNAAVVKVKKVGFGVGDTLYIKGHTTDMKFTVVSVQIDRVAIQKAKPGDEVGIEVKDRVREGDDVYKL